ncbi:MAG: AgmX/PglI C-terminal domain-containing protein [Pseudobdellovibrionaceae bacterium]
MLTLIVRQSLKNGTAKTWKLRPINNTYTFGSSRLSDVISIVPSTKGIQGLFEFRDGCWWYVNMDISTSAEGTLAPALCLESRKTIELENCILELTPISKEENLYALLDKSGKNKNINGKKFQLFIVKQNEKVLETKILPLNKKFKTRLNGSVTTISCVANDEWQTQKVNSFEISQKTVSLENASHLAHISMDQLVDKDSKRGLVITLSAAILLVGIGLLAPKNTNTEVASLVPKVAQKIIVKTELKPKRKKIETEVKPQQVVLQQPSVPAAAAGPKKEMPLGGGGGSKLANMMKSISGGRISQLIGKVSAQAAKSGNVIFATGVKAGQGPSGRALAAVGNIERSGRDWGSEGTGKGVVISTAGRGGGKNASGMGGLAAGGTGNAGVGLIEDESEITGGLDREIIAQYIKSKLGQILYCYERQLSAKPDLFGKVAVKFTIGPTGSVEQQLIGDTTLKNATVEGCILNKVAAWKFPTPQGGTRVLVTYPFLFKSTN